MAKDLSVSKSGKKSESNLDKSETLYFSTNETEKNIKTKEENEFLYFTPIPKEKKQYIPSTPRKPRQSNQNKDIDLTKVGRNLLSEFESL